MTTLSASHLSLLRGLASSVLAGAPEIECRVDERDVRERLGKVAQLPPLARVVLLREKPDVIAQGEEPLEQAARVVVAALKDVIVRQPEAAREECTLPGGQPV